MDRNTTLATASNLISKDRADLYGPPRQSFGRIGALWGAMLGSEAIAPEMVALMLVQLKVSRIVSSPGHEDSWVDLCGYGALGSELATYIEKREQPIVCSAVALTEADYGDEVRFTDRTGLPRLGQLMFVRHDGKTTIVGLAEMPNQHIYIDRDTTIEVSRG